ncbi:MAG: hypothetical protein LQ341_004871, partial [Variospora aurantia]
VREKDLHGVAFGAEVRVRERVFDGEEVAHVFQAVGDGELGFVTAVIWWCWGATGLGVPG